MTEATSFQPRFSLDELALLRRLVSLERSNALKRIRELTNPETAANEIALGSSLGRILKKIDAAREG